MKKNNGFTLTEVLLAVMIVGIIGVALASLTTAASRESGVGSSRVMLRNSLSVALRQLRQDVHQASRVLFVKGPLATAPNTASGTTPAEIPLLILARNTDVYGGEIENSSANADQQYIAYCFLRGNDSTLSSGDKLQPDVTTSGKETRDGGKITRRVWNSNTVPSTAAEFCPASAQSGMSNWVKSDWLKHVKFISSSYTYGSGKTYPVPLFSLQNFNATSYNDSSLAGQGAILDVKLIVELPSYPVVNEVVEERFLLSSGGSYPF